MELTKRISIKETLKNIQKKVTLAGWIYRKRDHGKVSFIDLRDSSGIIQIVVTAQTKLVNFPKDNLGLESVVIVSGLIKKRPDHMANKEIETGTVEMEAKELEVLIPNTDALPLDISKDIDKIHLDTLLNYRALTLRNPKMQAIFRFNERIARGYREFLAADGFMEIHTPKIIPAATEGGANVFTVDYFGRDVYLAQSPQFYKQMMVGVFEKVFEIGPVFRAEPHFTSRHLNEFTGLDAEIGFIKDEYEIMAKLEACINFIARKVDQEIKEDERKILDFSPLKLPKGKIPYLTLNEAVKIINKTQGVKNDNLDLDSQGEKIIGDYVLKKYKSDFVFITEYPLSIRPFYQMPKEDNPKVTKSFDIIFRGLELGTGAQRIHEYKKLLSSLKEHNLKPKDFEDYLDLFKFGMPPHGGWGLGLERFTKQWLNLDNVRLASLFPRDVKRVRP